MNLSKSRLGYKIKNQPKRVKADQNAATYFIPSKGLSTKGSNSQINQASLTSLPQGLFANRAEYDEMIKSLTSRIENGEVRRREQDLG